MTKEFDKLYKSLVDKFSENSVEKGYETEKEHHKSPEETVQIAKDHLKEFPDYYKELPKMEKKLKQKKRQK